MSRRVRGRAILEDVRLEAQPGELVAVVGKSGCGKTTLLRLIAGLDSPSSGEIKLEGGSVRMVFQEPRLLPWRSVLDNVLLGQPNDQAHRQTGREELARVGLLARARDWPAVLSGGERQRAALARALVSRPGLLLLDEPLGALDAFTRFEMQTLLENIWLEGRFTAVLVTHDVQEAVALADRVITLAAGRVAASVAIDLPRPRDRFVPSFTARVTEVLAQIGREGNAGVASAATQAPLAARRSDESCLA